MSGGKHAGAGGGGREEQEMPPSYEEASGASRPRPPVPGQSQGYHPGMPQQQGGWGSAWGQAPFAYPRGYFCNKCANTGIKRSNGHPCGTCERKFGRQGVQVAYAPPQPYAVQTSYTPGLFGGYTETYVPMAPQGGGMTVMAGDPRIGGRLCGNCKGYGVRSSMLGLVEEQCHICRGIGRILP
ncbi:hypothetical protein PYCC9005_001582 [Savitreella phatthalungensis]